MSRCSPSHSLNKGITDTCFSPSQISQIAEAVHMNPKYNVQGMVNIFIMTKLLHRVFGTQDGEEIKWLSDPRLPDSLKVAFRPKWSNIHTVLLSTTDIKNVLSQYEAAIPAYKHFRFMGVYPSDFKDGGGMNGGRCLGNRGMCMLSYNTLKDDGATDFGVVFNMDPHMMPGSHWVSVYGCIDPARLHRYGIWYYDSLARAPHPRIASFIKEFAAGVVVQNKKKVPPFPVGQNKIRKQFKNEDCGVYAIAFIVNCLTTNAPFDDICSNVMYNDDEIREARSFLWAESVPHNKEYISVPRSKG